MSQIVNDLSEILEEVINETNDSIFDSIYIHVIEEESITIRFSIGKHKVYRHDNYIIKKMQLSNNTPFNKVRTFVKQNIMLYLSIFN
jgi:hypothetical protein